MNSIILPADTTGAGGDNLDRTKEENNVDTTHVKFEQNFFANNLKSDNNVVSEMSGFTNFEGLGEEIKSHMVGYDFQKTISNYKKSKGRLEKNDRPEIFSLRLLLSAILPTA